MFYITCLQLNGSMSSIASFTGERKQSSALVGKSVLEQNCTLIFWLIVCSFS